MFGIFPISLEKWLDFQVAKVSIARQFNCGAKKASQHDFLRLADELHGDSIETVTGGDTLGTLSVTRHHVSPQSR